MINLTNVIKVFVFFGISIVKVVKLTDFFNPSISNQMSLIVSSVDNSVGAGGKQKEEEVLASISQGPEVLAGPRVQKS